MPSVLLTDAADRQVRLVRPADVLRDGRMTVKRFYAFAHRLVRASDLGFWSPYGIEP